MTPRRPVRNLFRIQPGLRRAPDAEYQLKGGTPVTNLLMCLVILLPLAGGAALPLLRLTLLPVEELRRV